MKKSFTLAILFLCSFLFLATKSQATHVMGSEILYQCTGNGTYKVTVKVYRDCNGIFLAQTPLVAYSGSNTVTVSNQTKVSVRDITTNPNGCYILSRCAGGGPYGIEEHIWEMTLDLSSYADCDWTLYWQQCCRNSAITTGQADQNFFTTAKLNKCISGCNNSPVFKNDPGAVALVCRNKDLIYDHGAIDALDNDSLSYHLVDPLQSVSNPASYNGVFSAMRPLSFLGFPNSNLQSPAGFHLNPTTGQLQFRPTQSNQIAVFVVEVKEWRMVNGQMTHIGSIRRDIQVIVIDCPNNTAPLIDVSNSASVCAGNKVCFPIRTTDLDPYDTVRISWNSSLPGATFTNNNGVTRLAQGEVCWTPDSTHVSSSPHIFTITAKDNWCKANNSTTDTISIWVRSGFQQPQFNFTYQNIQCGYYRFNHTVQGNYSGYQSFYFLRDSANQNVWFSNQMTDSVWLKPGNYEMTLAAYSDSLCYTSIKYPVQVAPVDTIGQYRVKQFCKTDHEFLEFGFSVFGTTASYVTWDWETSPGNVISKGSGNPIGVFKNAAGLYYGTGQVYNCVFIDSVSLSWIDPPNVASMSLNDTVCVSEYVQFSDTLLSGNVASHIWHFGDGDTSTSHNPQHFYMEGDSTYWVTHLSYNTQGCYDLDSIAIWVLPAISFDPLPASYTASAVDSCYLSIGQGQTGVSYQWQVDTGSGFVDLIANANYHGVNSPVLVIKPLLSNMSGNKYRCQASNPECTENSSTVTLMVTPGTSVQGATLANFKVYPNPAEGDLYIEMTEYSGMVSGQILSSTGQVVQRFDLNSPLHHIDIKNLAPGLYLLRLDAQGPALRFFKQ
ncbi:MAG: hypothetical protein EP332_11170 [Bacteroidetes bacterium]|nr:MAG: hypothetical protein EP332_11170 [Bacteroidota bacterium]